MNYTFLQRYQVGQINLKNRIILSAMSKSLCTISGEITEKYLEYYNNMSKGGMALITTGAMIIDEEWPSYLAYQPFITDDKFIPNLKRLTDIVHKNGVHIIFQLYHPGQVQYQDIKPKTLNELTIKELHDIQKKFVDAAIRAYKAGADGVDIHMAHTYLLSQFLSPYFNKRTDRYGCKTAEESMNFASECIAMIREATSPDFAITSKINGSDFIQDGMTIERATEIAILLEKAGVCMITVSAGGNQTDITAMSADGNRMEGWKVPFAKKIKESVNIPVAATGSIRHPWYANRCIENNWCDLISLGRTFLSEPNWLNKVINNQEEDLRYCISCLHCLSDPITGIPGCSINPICCIEDEYPDLIKNGNGRNVIVIGAGPAGLESAITLASRGFNVNLYEKNSYIGGMMALASIPPGKQKINWLIDFYEKQIKKLSINLYLNHNIDSNEILSLKPYATIIATGSNEFIPKIKGINQPNVHSVREILQSNSIICNKNIVIIGGGLTGLECARMMSKYGNNVTVLEMTPISNYNNLELKLAIKYAIEDNVLLKYEHKVVEICEDEVLAEDIRTNSSAKFPFDLVITSTGVTSNQKFYRSLLSKIDNLYCIGDCNKIGKIVNAISSGSIAGYSIGN